MVVELAPGALRLDAAEADCLLSAASFRVSAICGVDVKRCRWYGVVSWELSAPKSGILHHGIP